MILGVCTRYRIGRSRRSRDVRLTEASRWDTTLVMEHSNPRRQSRRETVSGGQFDWGGRLQKVTEAPEGSLRMVGKSFAECKGIKSLTMTTSRAGTKVRLSDPVVPHGRAIAQTDKATLGMLRLSPQESTSTGRFGTSMSAHRILGL